MSNQKHVYIDDLHFEHKTWASKLSFEKDELKTFNTRLKEIAPRWTSKDIMKSVEHFQNVFIRHNEVLDILLHNIKEHEHIISKEAIDNPTAINHVYFEDHGPLRDKVETQFKLYAELKEEFFNFLRKTM